jgi:hypothetical protein
MEGRSDYTCRRQALIGKREIDTVRNARSAVGGGKDQVLASFLLL